MKKNIADYSLVFRLLAILLCGFHIIASLRGPVGIFGIFAGMPHQIASTLANVSIFALAVLMFITNIKNKLISIPFIILGAFAIVEATFWSIASTIMAPQILITLAIKGICYLLIAYLISKDSVAPAIRATTLIAPIIISNIENNLYVNMLNSHLQDAALPRGYTNSIPNNTQDSNEWMLVLAVLCLFVANNPNLSEWLKNLRQKQLDKAENGYSKARLIGTITATLVSQIAFFMVMLFAYYGASIRRMLIEHSFSTRGMYFETMMLLFLIILVAEIAIYIYSLRLVGKGGYTLNQLIYYPILFALSQHALGLGVIDDLSDYGEGLESILAMIVYGIAFVPSGIFIAIMVISLVKSKTTTKTIRIAANMGLIYCVGMALCLLFSGYLGSVIDHSVTSNYQFKMIFSYSIIIASFILMGVSHSRLVKSAQPNTTNILM